VWVRWYRQPTAPYLGGRRVAIQLAPLPAVVSGDVKLLDVLGLHGDSGLGHAGVAGGCLYPLLGMDEFVHEVRERLRRAKHSASTGYSGRQVRPTGLCAGGGGGNGEEGGLDGEGRGGATAGTWAGGDGDGGGGGELRGGGKGDGGELGGGTWPDGREAAAEAVAEVVVQAKPEAEATALAEVGEAVAEAVAVVGYGGAGGGPTVKEGAAREPFL